MLIQLRRPVLASYFVQYVESSLERTFRNAELSRGMIGQYDPLTLHFCPPSENCFCTPFLHDRLLLLATGLRFSPRSCPRFGSFVEIVELHRGDFSALLLEEAKRLTQFFGIGCCRQLRARPGTSMGYERSRGGGRVAGKIEGWGKRKGIEGGETNIEQWQQWRVARKKARKYLLERYVSIVTPFQARQQRGGLGALGLFHVFCVRRCHMSDLDRWCL